MYISFNLFLLSVLSIVPSLHEWFHTFTSVSEPSAPPLHFHTFYYHKCTRSVQTVSLSNNVHHIICIRDATPTLVKSTFLLYPLCQKHEISFRAPTVFAPIPLVMRSKPSSAVGDWGCIWDAHLWKVKRSCISDAHDAMHVVLYIKSSI